MTEGFPLPNQIFRRLEDLREEMRRERIVAFIFPTCDPHHSENTANHWKGRQWISGFNGSSGTAVVTLNSAAVWTDSRYFIAAKQQLSGTEFELIKERMADSPTIAEWINGQYSKYQFQYTEVGVDGMCITDYEAEALIEALRNKGGLTLRTNLDILSRIWKDRPAIPDNPIVPQPLEYAGEDTESKLRRIRQALRKVHADGMLMVTLDDIAWTMNLRGSDVVYTPLFYRYLLITTQTATLYKEDEIMDALHRYPEYNILADPDEVSYTLMQAIHTPEIIKQSSPVPSLKAIKNEIEQEGFRHAMIRDGIAMVKFLHWLKPAVSAGGQTERTIAARLESLRSEQPLYRGLSFATIAGYEDHAAIVHYEATPESDATLKPQGLLLLDSGAQYQDGTTDITRTIALGPISEEQRHIYTLVLKGHIQLQLLKFPDGATGTQLDAIARRPLWNEGLNYMHGTGHGVGSYLCCHEGPHQIRMEYQPTPLRAGMTITDEPGIYLEGHFGVRIENTLLIQPCKQYPSFLEFETLTLCPIDTTPIDIGMLSHEELQWLNNYHKMVYEHLSPYLDEEVCQWLRQATCPLRP